MAESVVPVAMPSSRRVTGALMIGVYTIVKPAAEDGCDVENMEAACA